MTRTIKVTGKSNVKASPDYTRINLTISDILMEYDACLAKSVEDMNIIVECIKEFGFLLCILYCEFQQLILNGFNIAAEIRDTNLGDNRKMRQRIKNFAESFIIVLKGKVEIFGVFVTNKTILPIIVLITVSFGFAVDFKV